MSLASVEKQFEEEKLDLKVILLEQSSATVPLAAAALGVEPNRIAKTMAFKVAEESVLVVTAGEGRIDNKKYKEFFGTKAKMLKADEVLEITGHPVGGVCPFGLKEPMKVYLDETLKVFDYVYPAGGTPNSAVKIGVEELEKVTNGVWTSVCKDAEEIEN
ncbi:MAG: YbaK/EbsC family protein [Clostridia bacterium]|nr:YbaK/EbsC family protein [Clostridia bacterium]